MRQTRQVLGIEQASHLLDEPTFGRFQARVREEATQEILSQILFRDPLAPDPLAAAPSFLLIGQRFVIDSFITGNVVYPKTPKFRGLPSTMDVLFALGNNSATQFLTEELEEYAYAPNLAALRFLIDSQEPAFWQGTLYHGWLDAIRTLNPPASRDHLPAFMQTAAWWQQKMSTQLAAWAQLRHDNLLYAKQSYTGSIICVYPHTYIEPVPSFYRAIGTVAARAATTFDHTRGVPQRVVDYFQGMAAIADTLVSVTEKELAGSALTAEEENFLKTVMYDVPLGCTTDYRGWYSRLYYTGEAGFLKEDLVIADVHTQPTDANGIRVGHVLHVATGPLDMAVVIAELPESGKVAFVGPVFSFYERVTQGFERLTDGEWAESAAAGTLGARPDWVNIYLADRTGQRRSAGLELAQEYSTHIAESSEDGSRPTTGRLPTSYPNPFNSQTMIRFELADRGKVELTIYNMAGQRMAILIDGDREAGMYTVAWDGRDNRGHQLATGVYLYRLRLDDLTMTRKLMLLR